jgi:DNA-binding transcriptional ArsR family regulator
MDVLIELLSSKTRAAIVRLLFGLTPVPLHAREIERRAGVTLGAVRQEAAKLLRLGLVTVRKDGNRTYYEANRRHPLYEEIHRIVLKTAGLTDVLKAALADSGVQFAFVFGSVAQGTAKAESDVDLMIIGNIGLRKASALLSGVGNQLGREINPHVMTPQEYKDRLRRKEHFVANVMASPRILVVGNDDEFAAMGK